MRRKKNVEERIQQRMIREKKISENRKKDRDQAKYKQNRKNSKQKKVKRGEEQLML